MTSPASHDGKSVAFSSHRLMPGARRRIWRIEPLDGVTASHHMGERG